MWNKYKLDFLSMPIYVFYFFQVSFFSIYFFQVCQLFYIYKNFSMSYIFSYIFDASCGTDVRTWPALFCELDADSLSKPRKHSQASKEFDVRRDIARNIVAEGILQKGYCKGLILIHGQWISRPSAWIIDIHSQCQEQVDLPETRFTFQEGYPGVWEFA